MLCPHTLDCYHKPLKKAPRWSNVRGTINFASTQMIKKMTEKELARTIEDAVNNFSFDPNKVAAEVPMMHRTLQQNVYKLCKAIIEVIGADNYGTDPRNQAAHDECQAILTYLKENGRYIPLI